MSAAAELAEAIAKELGGLYSGIVPERVYTPEEAAHLCGWKDAEMQHPGRSFREGTKGRLPAVKLSTGGQRIGYYGRDLIRFIEEHREKVVNGGVPQE